MDQTLALNALAPYLALAKSATSPRAASDLITQATSAPNTYVFAELLRQPNIQALKAHDEMSGFFTLLQLFAWGTWGEYQATPGLPSLSDAQALKLRLLSLLSIASEKTLSTPSNLSYDSLTTRLGLSSAIDLEHLVTQAIYSNLLTGTLNPSAQTVQISSVAPLRDLAPGSLTSMIGELDAWSSRCTSAVDDLEAEIRRVKRDAKVRHAQEVKANRQARIMLEASEKGEKGSGSKNSKDAEAEDEMEVDGSSKKKGGAGGFMGRMAGGRVRGR